MPRVISPIVASLAVLIVGCGPESPRDRFIGVWTVDAAKTKFEASGGFMGRAKRTAMGTLLKLRPAGDFVLAGPLSFDGKWKLDPEGNVVLTPDGKSRWKDPVTLEAKADRLEYPLPSLPLFGTDPRLVLRKSG